MSKQAIEAGMALLIFPEGTRTKTGALGHFKEGPAKLSQATGAPLIPVAIKGAFNIYPPHRWIPKLFNAKKFKRYSIHVYFGKPIYPTTTHHKEQRELIIQL